MTNRRCKGIFISSALSSILYAHEVGTYRDLQGGVQIYICMRRYRSTVAVCTTAAGVSLPAIPAEAGACCCVGMEVRDHEVLGEK